MNAHRARAGVSTLQRLGRRLLLATTFFLLLLPASAPAGFDEGSAAYERGDYDTAFREFMPLAVAGEPWAQAMIGTMHESGLGVLQNSTEAAHWYRRSAEQSFAASQFRLGVLYATGKGLPRDHAEAVRLFHLAADQGVAQAQWALGVAYARGLGSVGQDFAEAARWYR